MAKSGSLEAIEVQGDDLTITTRSGEELVSHKESGDSVRKLLIEAGVNIGGAEGVKLTVKPEKSGMWTQLLLSFIPLLILGGLLFYMFRGARGAGNQVFNFSRSRARMFTGSKSTVTFADVAGVNEAKQELEEVTGH